MFRTGWTSWTGRTDGTWRERRETRVPNIEHRILNGEVEIATSLRSSQ
jgi:hypothetical protein